MRVRFIEKSALIFNFSAIANKFDSSYGKFILSKFDCIFSGIISIPDKLWSRIVYIWKIFRRIFLKLIMKICPVVIVSKIVILSWIFLFDLFILNEF